jgi:hypothetical protein
VQEGGGMSQSTVLGLRVLAAAVVLGVLGDGLLRTSAPGVNVVLWVGALVVLGLWLALRGRVAMQGDGRWMALPAIGFAAALAWRDSPTLQALNGLAAGVTLGLWAFYGRSGRLRLAGVTEYLLAVLSSCGQSLGGLFPLLGGEIEWKEIPRGRWSGTAASVTRGLALAVPLLLLFGGLFAGADAVFRELVLRLFDWDGAELLIHVLWIAVFTLIAGGALRMALLAKEAGKTAEIRPSGDALGVVEVGTVLGLLNGLFLAFVMVQFRYFFGGQARVMAIAGLTSAEYARSGFFELVWVTALVIPVLLVAHWLLRKETPCAERVYQALAGTLVAQLFVIMASAFQRMGLYQLGFGLTELRFYTTTFMIWMGVVLIWFAGTVLRGQRNRFAFGALVSALAAVALLNRVDPDAFIVRANAGRIAVGRSFDPAYVTNLSADAVPALVEALPLMSPAQRSAVAKRVQSEWTPAPGPDWREWNWSRERAMQIAVESQALVRAGGERPSSTHCVGTRAPLPTSGRGVPGKLP